MRPTILLLAIAFRAIGQKFDAASIKLHSPDGPSPGWNMEHGYFTVTNSAAGLIQTAYNLGNSDLVEGGPAWIDRDRYDVIAKGDPTAGPEKIRIMLQALLADRFHLESHREPKTLAGYSLNVDPKKTVRLPKAEEPTNDQPTEFLLHPHGAGFRAYHATFDQLCGFLWRMELNGPVVNDTELRGSYSLRLDFADPQPQVDATKDDAQFGTIFTAFEAIGLKLTPAKVPVEALHVDRLDRPTEN